MTELEGAILGVLRDGRAVTPYAVRRQFQISISAEWSGSAGAVYPAIRRMEKAQLVSAKAQKDGRGTKFYALTAKGRRAHNAWLCDVKRAAGPGLDPFRIRATMWFFLPAKKRAALMRALARQTARLHKQMSVRLASSDEIEAVPRDLHLRLLKMRLEWLKARR